MHRRDFTPWRRIAATLAGVTSLSSGVLPAAAQNAPNPAPQSSIRQTVPTREQIEATSPADTVARRPSVNVLRTREDGPCPLAGSDQSVTIGRLTFASARGGELPSGIAAVLKPLEAADGTPHPIRHVCDLRDAANQALDAAGFVASVQIPPQDVTDGTLKLVVVAARIVETRVTGFDGTLPRSIAARVEAIRALDPLNRREAERLLLLANDVPGLTLTLTLQPAGREPGDVIAIVDVQQERALVLANYQNYGSRQLGRSLFSLRGEFYNLTGLADSTFVGVSQSADWDEIHVFQGGHSIGLGSGGARLGIRGSYAWSNPDIPGLDLRSRSLIAGIDVSAPLVRRFARTGSRVNDTNIYVGAGAELLNQRSVIRSADTDVPYTRDRLRVAYARLGMSVASRDAFGLVREDIDLLIEARRGMSIFNATPRGFDGSGFQPSRVDGDPEAFELRGTFSVTVRPFAQADWFSFDLAAYGQYANHPLLNIEEFQVGSLTYGRGYDPGANAGDRALALHIAPRVRLTPASSAVQLEATAFYDTARLWNLDPGTSENNRLLRSVGGGLRVGLADRLSAELTYAHPLDRALSIDKRRPTDRVLLSITTQLAPWRFGR